MKKITVMTRFCLLAAFGFTLIWGNPPARFGLAAPAGSTPRRVNIPYFADNDPNESQMAIFWFGRNDSVQTLPGKNYVDVRIGYLPDGLYWRANVIDYYLWYDWEASQSDDLTHYDALAIYLDTAHDRATVPQSDDYVFLVGEHGGQDTPEYRRQARGTGSAWNTTWTGAWSDYSGFQWSDTGPNDNSGNIDFGWVGGGLIPWSTFGLSGPPADGTVWGFGVRLYDQDLNETSTAQVQDWPETFIQTQPASWGELRFGLPHYTPPPADQTGSATIRYHITEPPAPVKNVADAWMGGGGQCNSGHEGHTEDNHGSDPSLFIGSEIQPTHFPCYNKSYLRFDLSSIPSGKVILSATLTLHHWGGASYDPYWTESFIWLSSVSDSWDEMAIHWNNAPLAQENFSMVPVPPKETALVWPGDPYTWDASQAVADAYAAGQPVSFALYDSTTGRDSSKYFTGSEVGLGEDWPNWDEAGRPRLEVTWGDATNPPPSVTPPPSETPPPSTTPPPAGPPAVWLPLILMR